MTDPINILLVDDRPEGLLALEAVLRCPAYNLVHAHSGEEALYYYESMDLAVILLDVQMPGMDGFETAARMRSRASRGIVPIIFITAISKDEFYVYKGYEAGAVDYISKPFNPLVLRAKVSVFVELYRRNLEIRRQAELLRVSEQNERERQIMDLELKSLRRYEHLADAIPHFVWRLTPFGDVEYCNRYGSRYMGLTAESPVRLETLCEALAEGDRGEFMAAWEDARESGNGLELECRIRRATDASERWHLIRLVPERDTSRAVVGWVITATDIHVRKMAEDESHQLLVLEQEARVKAQQAQHDLERALETKELAELEMKRARDASDAANRAKSELLANMSHEIRTPLGVVLGFSELMADPTLHESDRSDLLRTIKRNGAQLCKLIDDILDLSKVEAGKLEVERVKVSLPKLLEDLSASFSFQCQKKGLDFRFSLESPIPKLIESDPTRLRQILMNMIGNSIKFTEQGSIELAVRYETQSSDPCQSARVCFRIIDSGIGIPTEKHTELFNAFVQADGSTTRKYGGTGLGLALSKRLAASLGGDVVLLKSEAGAGSIFEVSIDPGHVDPSNLIDQVNGIARRGQPVRKGATSIRHLEGLTILCADDSLDNQRLIRQILMRAGAEVELAQNGAEAVEKALSDSYDLVLMDIQMPELDGYEATMRLRSQGYDKPILALTAHAMKNEEQRCLDAGCDTHLTKPINRDRLVEQIIHFVRGGRRPTDARTLTGSQSE